MSYYVSGYYQEKAILKKEGQLFFLKCEEADAPTGTMVQGNTARLITELPEKEQQEIRQIYDYCVQDLLEVKELIELLA